MLGRSTAFFANAFAAKTGTGRLRLWTGKKTSARADLRLLHKRLSRRRFDAKSTTWQPSWRPELPISKVRGGETAGLGQNHQATYQMQWRTKADFRVATDSFPVCSRSVPMV